MRRVLFGTVMVLMAFLTSSCVKEPLPEKEIHFSVLGDSFSSLEGTVDPDSNDIWTYYSNIGVTDVDQMWWYQLASKMSWTLEKNNSFSGSLICNLNVADYYGPHSYLRRMNDLGNPDVILVFGGTNDVWEGASFGDFVYSDWTEEQLCEIRPALAYLFDGLNRLYPNAKVYFMVDMDICSGGADEEQKQLFIESAHHVANHYRVKCVDLWYIHKEWWHPDAQGQRDIASQMIEALQADFNV